jgi:hypothetical protein
MKSIKAKNEQNAKVLTDIDMESELTEEEFKELLQKIDSGLRGLPATAQVFLGCTSIQLLNCLLQIDFFSRRLPA